MMSNKQTNKQTKARCQYYTMNLYYLGRVLTCETTKLEYFRKDKVKSR
jgi:hypothetical protein